MGKKLIEGSQVFNINRPIRKYRTVTSITADYMIIDGYFYIPAMFFPEWQVVDFDREPQEGDTTDDQKQAD